MRNKMPTVFTNTEIGKQLQKMWLEENKSILTKTYRETKADFIWVTPNDFAGEISACTFIKLDELENLRSLGDRIVDRIRSYILEKKSDGKVIVIFMNLEGRLSYYTYAYTETMMEEK
jgi:hypothetical protein